MATTKQPKPRYVLIIEDNIHHAELVTECLDKHFAPVIIHTVDTIDDGLEFASQATYNLIITSAVVRDTPVINSMSKLYRIADGSPIIVISGNADERMAAELIKKGATEYFSKTKETLDNLPSLLKKHLERKLRSRLQHNIGAKETTAKPSFNILREIDKLTQKAVLLTNPKNKHRSNIQHTSELKELLSQIKRLKEMTSKIKR